VYADLYGVCIYDVENEGSNGLEVRKEFFLRREPGFRLGV
jgi:hypothetical protein